MVFSLSFQIRLSGLFLFFLLLSFTNNLGAEVSIPSVTDPIKVTADSYPFCAANRSVVPQDLGKYGYVEEEYFVSGKANVYDFDETGFICGLMGYKVPFEKEVIRKLHKTREDYLSKVNEMVDSLVKERFILREDGKKIKKQAEEVKAWMDSPR